MSESTSPSSRLSTQPVVVVTGANGFVGASVCAALVERGAAVRALVRSAGTAPVLEGVEEHVGEFFEPSVAAAVVDGAYAVVTTVHPMGTDRENQHRVGVQGTPVLARAARDAGVDRLVHISTAAVYDRSPEADDVDERSPLVSDDANDYAVTKRDTDRALAEVEGITRVLVRPPAILGPGRSSIWNTLRPADIRTDEDARRVHPDQTFAWIHVEDLAVLIADLATGRIASAPDPDRGPIEGGCTEVNAAAAGPATARDYYGTVAAALGVDLLWQDGPAWTGSIRTERARSWGWTPRVDLAGALEQLVEGLRG